MQPIDKKILIKQKEDFKANLAGSGWKREIIPEKKGITTSGPSKKGKNVSPGEKSLKERKKGVFEGKAIKSFEKEMKTGVQDQIRDIAIFETLVTRQGNAVGSMIDTLREQRSISLAAIVIFLGNEDSEVRAEALKALDRILFEKVAIEHEDAITGKTRKVQIKAGRGMGDYEMEVLVNKLVEFLRYAKNNFVHADAVIGVLKLIPKLTKKLTSRLQGYLAACLKNIATSPNFKDSDIQKYIRKAENAIGTNPK